MTIASPTHPHNASEEAGIVTLETMTSHMNLKGEVHDCVGCRGSVCSVLVIGGWAGSTFF